MHMGFMWGNLKESDHLEEQSADGAMLKLVLKKNRLEVDLVWLTIGNRGGLSRTK